MDPNQMNFGEERFEDNKNEEYEDKLKLGGGMENMSGDEELIPDD